MMLTRNWIIGSQKHIPCVILFLRDDPIKSLRGRSSLEQKRNKRLFYKRREGGESRENEWKFILRGSYNFYIVLKQYCNKPTEK